jgi:hypothetical protein
MTGETVSNIDHLKKFEVELPTRRITYTEDYQGEGGGKTPEQAGVNYRYFYLDFKQMVTKDEVTQTLHAVLSMDEKQIKDGEWQIVDVTAEVKDGAQSVLIKATSKEGLEALLRHNFGKKVQAESISFSQKEPYAHAHFIISRQDGVIEAKSSDPEIGEEQAEFALLAYQQLAEITLKMKTHGFKEGKPSDT